MPIWLTCHPAHISDLALSALSLFGHIKKWIVGQKFASPDELIAWMSDKFDLIQRSILERMFNNRSTRLQTCIDHQGFHSSKN
jgi:hypothetical protein